MPLLAFEKEIGQRVRLRSSGKLKRVSELGAKVGFDRGGFVVLVRRCCSDLCGQLRDTWIKRRQLEIILRDIERSEEHTSELQSQSNLVCRLLLEKKKK